ncbi:hypothetical protein F2Q70_00002822 [Brassica cretica]|nr:hypothetical protein F2Q70_00002822 [Brassica cretica]
MRERWISESDEQSSSPITLSNSPVWRVGPTPIAVDRTSCLSPSLNGSIPHRTSIGFDSSQSFDVRSLASIDTNAIRRSSSSFPL